MEVYEQPVGIRWSDLDPNGHLRHSVYYDYGALSWISFLTGSGITPEWMGEHAIGPILFREECIFRKEIRFRDKITVNLKLDKARADISRWTMIHELWKNVDTLAAIITVDGAWIDTNLRKLALPPEFFKSVFEHIPKTTGFRYIGK